MKLSERFWAMTQGVVLTHWGRDKIAAILQTTFSLINIVVFWLKFRRNLFLIAQLTVYQHWFRQWLGAEQATSHYLKWWLHSLLTHICVTRLNWYQMQSKFEMFTCNEPCARIWLQGPGRVITSHNIFRNIVTCPCPASGAHYSDVIMGSISSQINSLTIVYSSVDSADIKENIKAPRHWRPDNSPHKGLVTRKMFPFDDVIMNTPHMIIIKISWAVTVWFICIIDILGSFNMIKAK